MVRVTTEIQEPALRSSEVTPKIPFWKRAIKHPAGLIKKSAQCPLLGGLQTGTSRFYDRLCLDLPEVRSMDHGAFLRFFWDYDFYHDRTIFFLG